MVDGHVEGHWPALNSGIEMGGKARRRSAIDDELTVGPAASSGTYGFPNHPSRRLRGADVCRQRTGGIKPMHHEHVEITWSEAVTALAMMGIITFLLML
jgi:hypothetical protein